MADAGLELRVGARGVRWGFKYEFADKKNRLIIGGVDDWTISEARDLVTEARKLIRSRQGMPDEAWLDRYKIRQGKMEAIQLVEDGPKVSPRALFKWTFGKAREEFIADITGKRRAGTINDYRQKLSATDLSSLDDRPMPAITRQEMAMLIAEIAASGREATAEGTVRVVRRFWNWCAEDNQVKSTGVAEGVMSKLKAPDRVLDEDDDALDQGYVPSMQEVGRIIAIARSGAIDSTIGSAIELVCWTLQRRRAIAEARVKDFIPIGDGTRGLWRIPPTSMKVRKKGGPRAHVIPLPAQAWSFVQGLIQRTNSEWLFPQLRARTYGDDLTHIHVASITHNMAWLPGTKASPHDLRRAFGTHGENKLGWLRPDTLSILDHANGEVSDVTGKSYALHDGTHRKWPIMTLWCDAVDAEIQAVLASLEPVEALRAAIAAARYKDEDPNRIAAE